MISARQIAFEVLNNLNQGHHTLDYWLDKVDAKLRQMDPKERALARALSYGALRWQSHLDFIIDTFAQKPRKIDRRVRTILRIAVFQLTQLERIPVSAIVNTAVDLAKNNQRAWAAGFVNGLLRRATTGWEQVVWPDWEMSPESALAKRLAIPQWLAVRWIKRWGLDEARRLCESINTIPDVTLRTNTLKTQRDALIAAIASEARQMAVTGHTTEGVTMVSLNRPVTQWPSFADGWFQVQDEAAQLVGHCVAPKAGQRVWDACAGLGTKTAHLAQLMSNTGTLMASDQSASKIDKLQKEMHRLGITMVQARTLDILHLTDSADWPQFDRILVDAPCSGLGVLQKNPDGKWRTEAGDLVRNQHRQIELLNRVTPFIRPNGRLIYSVCSREPEENEDVIKAFLQKHPEFAIYPPKLTAVARPDTLLTAQGWLATLPHRNGMDGFFVAVLRKTH